MPALHRTDWMPDPVEISDLVESLVDYYYDEGEDGVPDPDIPIVTEADFEKMIATSVARALRHISEEIASCATVASAGEYINAMATQVERGEDIEEHAPDGYGKPLYMSLGDELLITILEDRANEAESKSAFGTAKKIRDALAAVRARGI